MPKACPYVVMWFVPLLIVVGMNHRISSRLTQIAQISRAFFVGEKSHGWTDPPFGRAYQLLNRLNKKEDSTKVGMRKFDFVRVLIRGNLCEFVAEKIPLASIAILIRYFLG